MSNNAHHRETRFTKNITKRYERVQSPMGMREVSGRKVSGCLLYGSVSHRDRWELGNCAWTVIPGEERASAPWGKNQKEYSGPTCLRGQRKQSILGKAEWVGGLQVGQGSGFGRHRDVARCREV